MTTLDNLTAIRNAVASSWQKDPTDAQGILVIKAPTNATSYSLAWAAQKYGDPPTFAALLEQTGQVDFITFNNKSTQAGVLAAIDAAIAKASK